MITAGAIPPSEVVKRMRVFIEPRDSEIIFWKFAFSWSPWQSLTATALTHFLNYFCDSFVKICCSRDAASRWQESRDAWKCVPQRWQVKSINRLWQMVLNSFGRVTPWLPFSDVLSQIAQVFLLCTLLPVECYEKCLVCDYSYFISLFPILQLFQASCWDHNSYRAASCIPDVTGLFLILYNGGQFSDSEKGWFRFTFTNQGVHFISIFCESSLLAHPWSCLNLN